MRPSRAAVILSLVLPVLAIPSPARDTPDELERVCLGGDASACGSLGAMYRAGTAVRKDIVKSAMYYLRACAEASPSNPWCRQGGEVSALAKDSDEDALRSAVEALGPTCEAGADHDCNVLGFIRGSDNLFSKDPAEARALFLRACRGKAPAGCSNLGDAYISGAGVPKDAAKALELYSRACSNGFVSGCADAGQIYSTGAVAGGASKAAPLFRAACDGGDGFGCAAAGRLASGGAGGVEDPQAAARDFKKACDLGFPAGCQGLVKIYRADPERAAALFKEVCGADVKQCRQFDALVEGIQAADGYRRR